MEVQKVTTSDNVVKIIKKTCSSNKLTVCMGQRDFIDCYTHIEVIDGVVNMEMEQIRNSDVIMMTITSIFRYGREDAEALGMDFRKQLYKHSQQIFPVVRKREVALSKFQQKLMDKMGEKSCFPFTVELPRNTPASVSLQVEPGEPGKPCGVDYELCCYVTDDMNKGMEAKDSVSMLIRKLTFASLNGPGRKEGFAERVKEFGGNKGNMRVEVSIAREVYYHGEMVQANVTINNNSDKTIKRIKLSILQVAEIVLHQKYSYHRVVAEMESEEGFPILPGQLGFCRSYQIMPTISMNREKIGLAMDGKLKYEDTGLASSTIVHEAKDRENMGIIISYFVKAKLIFGFGTSDISVQAPFLLSHPSKYAPMPTEMLREQRRGSSASYASTFGNQEEEALFNQQVYNAVSM